MLALLGGGRSGNDRGYRLLNVLSAIGDLCFLVALKLARGIGAILQLVYSLGSVFGLKALLNVGVENEAGDNATSDDINKGAFDFDWGVAAQFLLLLLTLLPFAFGNQRWLVLLCLSFALCYALLIRRDRRRGCRDPNLEALDRRFPPPLLSLLGLCYAGVAAVLGMAAQKLRGPPLCFARCKTCLSRWKAAVFFDSNETASVEPNVLFEAVDYYEADLTLSPELVDDAYYASADTSAYCGAANGAELVGFFAVAQSATFIFLSGILVIIVCLAWSLSNFEKNKRGEAVKWLKTENCLAFALREELCLKVGQPGTDPRVSLDREWICCGIGFALAFSNLGLKRWRDLDYAKGWTYLYVLLHICITFISFMLIHVGFYGRLRVLYLRSLSRTKLLTQQLSEILKSEEDDAQKAEEGRGYNSGTEIEVEDDFGLFMPEAQVVERLSDSEIPFADSFDPVNSNISLTRAGSMSNSSLQGAAQVEKFVLCVDGHRSGNGRRLEAWWTERLFVFITDISLDYSMAGLGMSTTFVLVLALFALVSIQLWNEGFWGLLAPPASYCVCGISYMVYCMYQMLEIAKETYREQQNHGEFLSRYRAMLGPNSAKVDYVNSMLVQIREYDPLPTVMGFPIRPKGPQMFEADRT